MALYEVTLRATFSLVLAVSILFGSVSVQANASDECANASGQIVDACRRQQQSPGAEDFTGDCRDNCALHCHCSQVLPPDCIPSTPSLTSQMLASLAAVAPTNVSKSPPVPPPDFI
jgi:hypothetical protein